MQRSNRLIYKPTSKFWCGSCDAYFGPLPGKKCPVCGKQADKVKIRHKYKVR